MLAKMEDDEPKESTTTANRVLPQQNTEEKALWIKKCNLLKRKCDEYEEMNDILLARTRKIHCMIQTTESEKSLLIKRLEQFEVLDEIPRYTVSLTSDTIPYPDNEKALLATAVKIRAELDSQLLHLKSLGGTSEQELKMFHVPNNAHHSNSHSVGGYSPSGFKAPTPHSRAISSSTPLQSPIASVIVTPTSLVPASVPILGTGTSSLSASKAKKTKGTKVKAQNTSSRGNPASKRKKPDADPNAPKKPSNAFFWFCQERRASLQEQFREEGVSGQHDLTKALAKLWSETPNDDKTRYYNKYTVDKARYDKEMEEYSLKKQEMAMQTKADSATGGGGSSLLDTSR